MKMQNVIRHSMTDDVFGFLRRRGASWCVVVRGGSLAHWSLVIIIDENSPELAADGALLFLNVATPRVSDS